VSYTAAAASFCFVCGTYALRRSTFLAWSGLRHSLESLVQSVDGRQTSLRLVRELNERNSRFAPLASVRLLLIWCFEFGFASLVLVGVCVSLDSFISFALVVSMVICTVRFDLYWEHFLMLKLFYSKI
jgi:hypothetical protein